MLTIVTSVGDSHPVVYERKQIRLHERVANFVRDGITLPDLTEPQVFLLQAVCVDERPEYTCECEGRLRTGAERQVAFAVFNEELLRHRAHSEHIGGANGDHRGQEARPPQA